MQCSGARRSTSLRNGPSSLAFEAPKGQSIVVDGQDVVPEVHAVLDKMADFPPEYAVESGRLHRKPIRNVINIGIGGLTWGRYGI